MKRILTIFAVLVLSSQLFAAGFALAEQGARALGMAGAFTATAGDASANFYNPAGLAWLENEFQIGTCAIMPTATFTGPDNAPNWGTVDMEQQTFFPSTIYASYACPRGRPLTFGLGVFTPYGLGTLWEEDWLGRHISEEINLMTFDFNFNLAWMINDQVAIGGGYNYVYGMMELSKDSYVTPVDTEVDVNIEGTAIGQGWNAGLMIKPMPLVTIGINWRSSITLEGESGTATFDYAATGRGDWDAFLETSLPEMDVSTDIKLPEQISMALALHPFEWLTVEADANYTGWVVYDALTIDFAEETDIVTDSVQEKDFQSVWNYRFGLEYFINEQLTLRGGFYLDRTPIKQGRLEPSLPDADRNGYTFGMGYQLTERMQIDLYYLNIRIADRVSTFEDFPGFYQSGAQAFGVSYAINF
ncbi:MAG: outer membrane protein transport protein [Candidatus Delongbacteria bacterium]|nr:outer membrane protein transport protein [Candidatus Delongbacteria bacterium]